jgi:copper chaperone CopZ
MCHGCANTIITQLTKLNGISDIKFDTVINTVSFNYNSQKEFSIAKMKLSDLGYPMVGKANQFSKKVKSFASCSVGRMTK